MMLSRPLLGAILFALGLVATGSAHGGEFLIDNTPDYALTPSSQNSAAVAFGGMQYLAVWADDLNGNWDIYGARISRAGALLDTPGFAVSVGTGDQSAPAVAFCWPYYLVVWQDSRGGEGCDIYCARVTTQGDVLDPSGIPVSSWSDDQLTPAVASDGDGFIAVWSDYRDDAGDIYAARITTDGLNRDRWSGIRVVVGDYEKTGPAIAFGDGCYLVAWEDQRSGWRIRDIYGSRLTSQGLNLDPGGFPISAFPYTQTAPALAWLDTVFLVAWADERTGPNGFDIYGARVTAQGEVIDSLGFAIAQAVRDQECPMVSHDGSVFAVVWQDSRRVDTSVFAARVTPAGTVLDSTGIAVSENPTRESEPALAFGTSSFLVVWTDARSESDDVFASRLARDGGIADPEGIAVSYSISPQWQPDVAGAGADYLVVWEDDRNSQVHDIYAARLTGQGVILDPDGFAVSAGTTGKFYPAVACNGPLYLVVWADVRGGTTDIYAARVTGDGRVLDRSGIAVCAVTRTQTRPAVASDGQDFLVVWQDSRGGGSNYDIYGARVTAQGMVLDSAGFPISLAPDYQRYPAVAFGQGVYFVVWQDERDGRDIYGARVTPQALVLDTAGTVISAAAGNQYYPDVVSSDSVFLVAWRDGRGSSYNIYAARVTGSGQVLDSSGLPVAPASHSQSYPAVASDSTGFVVLWYEAGADGTWDVRGAQVMRSGAIRDTFAVTDQAGDQSYPALARGRPDQMLFVYRGWTGIVNGLDFSSYRIWGRFWPFPKYKPESLPPEVLRRPEPVPTIVRRTLNSGAIPGVGPETRLALYDAMGRLRAELEPGSGDVSRLPAGLYFVRSIADRERVFKFVKE